MSLFVSKFGIVLASTAVLAATITAPAGAAVVKSQAPVVAQASTAAPTSTPAAAADKAIRNKSMPVFVGDPKLKGKMLAFKIKATAWRTANSNRKSLADKLLVTTQIAKAGKAVEAMGYGDAVDKTIEAFSATKQLKITRTGTRTIKVKLPKNVAKSIRTLEGSQLRQSVVITLEHLKDTSRSISGRDLLQVNQNTASNDAALGSTSCDEQWCTTYQAKNLSGFNMYLSFSNVQCVWTLENWNSSVAFANGLPNGGVVHTPFNVSSETDKKSGTGQAEFVSQVISAAEVAGEQAAEDGAEAAVFAASDGAVGTGYAASAKKGAGAIGTFLETVIKDEINDSCSTQVKQWSTAWTALSVDTDNPGYYRPNWGVMDSTANMKAATSIGAGFVTIPTSQQYPPSAPSAPALSQYVGATSSVTWGWDNLVVTPGSEGGKPTTGSYFTGPFTAVSWNDQSSEYGGGSSKHEDTPSVFMAIGFDNYVPPGLAGSGLQFGPVPGQPAPMVSVNSSGQIACATPAQWILNVPWSSGSGGQLNGTNLANWSSTVDPTGPPPMQQNIQFWTYTPGAGGTQGTETDLGNVTSGFPPDTNQGYNSTTSAQIAPLSSPGTAGCTVTAWVQLQNTGSTNAVAQFNNQNFGWNSYPPVIGSAPAPVAAAQQ